MSNLLALPNGTELVGDYRIKRVLGAGGFGITYLAEEPSLARLVTIKEYFPADFAARTNGNDAAPRSQNCRADYQWGLDRFIEEAQTLAKFDHPNIVRVYRYFRLHQTGYMVLHFEEGSSFKKWLTTLQRAPRQSELDAIIAPLLNALALIHKANFLHRDIAPDNIIIRKDGNPVLIDFGSARGAIAQHSQTISALVKPGYSPYEQYAMTGRSQGPWTDIYSLGAALYFAISGKRPADAPSRIIDDELLSAGEVALSSYRPTFLAAIDKALQLNVAHRPQSVDDWRRELMANATPGHAITPQQKQQDQVPAPPAAPVAATPPRAPSPAANAQNAQMASAIGAAPAGGGAPATPQTPRQQRQQKTEMPKQARPAAAAAAARPKQLNNNAKTRPVPPGETKARRGLVDLLSGMKKRAAEAAIKKPSSPIPLAKKASVSQAAGAGAPRPDIASEVTQPAPKPPSANQARQQAAKIKTGPDAKIASPDNVKAAKRRLETAMRKPTKASPRRKPPQPRKIRTSRPAGLRSAMIKLLVGISLVGAVVALQDRLPRLETRGFGLQSSLHTDVALTNRLQGHQGGATGIAFSQDAKQIISTGADATIKIWNAVNGSLIRTIELDNGPASAFAVRAKRAATGHKDGSVVLWDLVNGSKIASFKRNEANIWSVAFAGDPGRIVASAHDWSVTLWDEGRSGGPIHVFKGHENAVQAVAFSPRGPYIASGGADEKVKLWSASQLRLLRTYHNISDFVTSISFSRNGRRMAVASLDGNIKIFSTKSRRTWRRLRGHDTRVTALAYAPNNKHLASAGIDGTIRLWNAENGRTIKIFDAAAGPVQAISFSHDGRYLASATHDGSLQTWQTSAYFIGRKRQARK